MLSQQQYAKLRLNKTLNKKKAEQQEQKQKKMKEIIPAAVAAVKWL